MKMCIMIVLLTQILTRRPSVGLACEGVQISVSSEKNNYFYLIQKFEHPLVDMVIVPFGY